MTSYIRRAAVVALCALAAGLAAAPTANAGLQRYLDGFVALGGGFGDRHTISWNQTWSRNPEAGVRDVCLNAVNESGTSWVGTTQCHSQMVSQPYCACALRYPWAGPAYQAIYMYAESSW